MNIRFLLPSKVAQFQDARFGVQKKILRFDVTMTDAQCMNVRQTPHQLIRVQLHTTHNK